MYLPISGLGPAERFAERAVPLSGLTERLQELLAIFADVGASHCLSRECEWLAISQAHSKVMPWGNADLMGKLIDEVNGTRD